MTLPPSRAIDLLRRRVEELRPIVYGSGDFSEWEQRTLATLERCLPAGHRAIQAFKDVRWSPMVFSTGSPDSVFVDSWESGKRASIAVLNSVIYELEELDDSDPASPVLDVAELKALERFISAYQTAQDSGELDQLDPEDRAEMAAEVETLESQRRSPRPKRVIVREALRSIRSIVEQAAGGAIGGGLVLAAQDLARHIR